jgi:hypothetical protein
MRLGRLSFDDLALSAILVLLLPSSGQQLRAASFPQLQIIMIWEFCEICWLGSINAEFQL